MSKFKRPVIASLDDVADNYVLNSDEIGRILDIDKSTASDFCARGVIVGAFQVGRYWRIRAGVLKKDIERKQLPHNEQIANLREAARPRRRAS